MSDTDNTMPDDMLCNSCAYDPCRCLELDAKEEEQREAWKRWEKESHKHAFDCGWFRVFGQCDCGAAK